MADEGTQSEGRRTFGAGLRETYERIPSQRRWLIAGVSLAVVVGLVVLASGKSGNEGWRAVARDMLPEDIEAAKKAFDEKKIAYKLADSGTLMVAPESIHEARLSLAVSSMPSGRSVGFELFDESGMGRSAFTEKVNLHRALEGELARTIRHIEGIDRVRVHLVTPERRVFREMDATPSASVVVSLRNGQSLSRDQARAIQRLVAGAVERMQPSQVAILDQYGAMLAGPEEGPMTGAAFERQREQENELERRVIRLIEPIVGSQKVMAKVAVELDFSQVVETREDFDPEQQVIRSEREQIERTDQATAQPIGAPGTPTNLPGRQVGPRGQAAGQANREKSDTIRNYEVDKVIRRTENPLPRLKRLSVAVVVDEASDGKGGMKPRTKDEIAQIERLAARAVGLDATRGDTIEVTSAPFAVIDPTDPQAPTADPLAPPVAEVPWYEQPTTWIIGGVAALLLIGAVVAMLMRSRAQKKRSLALAQVPQPRLTPAFTELGEAMLPEQVVDRRVRIAELRERAIELGNEDLHRLGVVFKRWFEQDAEEKPEAAGAATTAASTASTSSTSTTSREAA